LARRVLSLPMHPYLDDATIERIAKLVRAAT
jgi:dTDP-4-amino-4,6-dideoxygalactose transaminase